MERQPRKALILLDSMEVPSKINKKEYATYHLLLTQALDKNYIKPTSDSIINLALEYFDKQKDPVMKAKALYYAGRVNYELQNAKEATTYYLSAAELIEELDGNEKLLSLIYSNLGYVYLYQKLHEDALPVLQKAHHYIVELNDSTELPYTYRDLGRVYGKLDSIDTAESYFNEGIKIARITHNEQALCSLLNEIAYVYKKDKNYDLAVESLLEAKEIRERRKYWDNSQLYINLAEAYIYTNQYDSANLYLDKALHTNNIHTFVDVYKLLYKSNKFQHKYKEAVEKNDLFLMYSDTLASLTYKKEIAEIKEKYEHEKLVNENNTLTIQKGNIQKVFLVVSIITIAMIFLMVYFYQNKLLHKERNLQKIKEQVRTAAITIKDNEAIIRRNDEVIKAISDELNENKNLVEQINEFSAEIDLKNKENEVLRNQNKKLQADIESSIKSLQNKDVGINSYEKLLEEKTILTERESELTDLLIQQFDSLKKLTQKDTKFIDEKYCNQVLNDVNLIFNNFTQRLSANYPALSNEDLQFSCLIKLRFSTRLMADLCCISAPAVTKRKQRIKDKIGLNASDSLDSFIWNY